jgi:hypothetical protein
MTNHANEAARYLGDRIAVASPLPLRRERYAARPWQAGAANYLAARIAKASEPDEALIEHPDRPRQWVRPALISDRDRTPAVPSSPPGPGRETFTGGEAA